MKKKICMLLAGTMLAGSLGTTGFAQEETTTTEPMELTMYFPVSVGGGPDALIDDLCAQYHEENPNITINPVYAGSYADTRTKVQAAIKGGNTPDLAIMFSIDLYSLLAMDAIADIDSLCTTEEDQQWLDGFYDGFMMNSRDGETTYGIPWQRSTIVLYYNKDAFEAAGLDPEQPPTTWDELLDVCATLKEKYPDKFPFGFSANDNEEGTFQFLPFFFSTGATLEEFGSDAGVKALDLWKTMVDEGYVSKDVVSWGQSEVKSQFEAGNVLMEVNGSWDIAQMKIDVPDKEIGVFQIPKDSEYASILGGEGFAMSTSCEDPEIGWNYLKTLGSGKNIAEFAEASACFPARTDGEEYSDYWTSDEQMAVFNEAVKNAKVRGPHARWTEISEEISGAIQAVLTGAKDAKTAMGEAQEKINSIMES